MHRMVHSAGSPEVRACLCAVVLAGCSSPQAQFPPAVYRPILLPPDIECIGLTVARPTPEFSLQLPETKSDAARSVAADAVRDMARDPYAATALPLGYVLGGVFGGINGVSENELKMATPSISAAIRAHPVDARLVQMLHDRLESEFPGRVRVLPDNIPLEPEPVQGHLRQDDHHRVSWMKPEPPAHPLVGSGIEVVVGLRVTFLGFRPRTDPRIQSTGDMHKVNPPLSLVVEADIVAVRVGDWADLGGSTLRYEGPPRRFVAWAADDAAPLHRELEATLQELQRQCARQLSRQRADSGQDGS